MNKGLYLVGGIGLGAGLVYLLDPNSGRRRRALVRDRVIGALSRIENSVDRAATDLANRAQDLGSEVRAWFVSGRIPDDVLVERVRSNIGRNVSHPHAVGVAAHEGQVVLTGSVLEREVDSLLRAVSSVRGVDSVVASSLVATDQPGNRPWLQDGRKRSGGRPNILEENWAPATRLLAGAAGGGMLIYGFTRRFPVACVLGTAGLGLLARSTTNTGIRRMLGLSKGRRAVDVCKTLTISRPVERVFECFARYEAFPSFMAHLREVRDLGSGRSHWVAEGPMGIPVSWDAVLTRFEPDELLAWQSEPGSAIPNAGIVRFGSTTEGATRVDIRFSYNPPGGVLGHFAAMLFGADAKSAMDEDLLRFKHLLEEGSVRAPKGGEEIMACETRLAL